MTLPFKLPVRCDDGLHLFGDDTELIAELVSATPEKVTAIVERINTPRRIYIATETWPEVVGEQDEEENVEDILWSGHPYLSLEAAQSSIAEDIKAVAMDHHVAAPTRVNWKEEVYKGLGPKRAWSTRFSGFVYLIREYEL